MNGAEFEKIYQVYFDQVYRFLLKLSGDEQIAEEITSETFFKAINSLDKFEEKCSIGSWLCQIGKNTYCCNVEGYARRNSCEYPLSWYDLV